MQADSSLAERMRSDIKKRTDEVIQPLLEKRKALLDKLSKTEERLKECTHHSERIIPAQRDAHLQRISEIIEEDENLMEHGLKLHEAETKIRGMEIFADRIRSSDIPKLKSQIQSLEENIKGELVRVLNEVRSGYLTDAKELLKRAMDLHETWNSEMNAAAGGVKIPGIITGFGIMGVPVLLPEHGPLKSRLGDWQ